MIQSRKYTKGRDSFIMLKEKQEFFKMIRKRILENNYAKYSITIRNQRLGEVYFLNNKRMSREQIRTLSHKINEMVQSDDFIYGPLNKLILDHDEFMNLDEIGKQRYILDLSNIYIDIKNKYLNDA